jgi:hypothetical protein
VYWATFWAIFPQTHLVTLLGSWQLLVCKLLPEKRYRTDWRRIFAGIAGFFLPNITQTGKNVPNGHKMYQIVLKYPKYL